MGVRGRGADLVEEGWRGLPSPDGAFAQTKIGQNHFQSSGTLAKARYGLDVVVVRPRFIWGRDDTTALPTLLAAVQSGQFAWISGGGHLTTTTHIANLCHGVELAAIKGRGGEVYFLGDEEPVRFRDFASALMKTHGVTHPPTNPCHAHFSAWSPELAIF